MGDVPNRLLVDTTDPKQAAAVVATLLSPHILSVGGDRDGFRARVRHLQLGDIQVTHFRYGSELEIVAQPLDSYAVNFMLQGSTETFVGRECVHSETGDAVVYSPHTPFRLTCSQDHEMLCLVVPTTAVSSRARKLTAGSHSDITFTPFVDRESGGLVRSAVATALQLAHARSDELPVALGWELRDAVLAGMLLGLRHSHSDAINQEPRDASFEVLDQAMAEMRANLASPIPIPRIASRIGVPLRVLQEAFRAHCNMTPLACYKRLRLEAVHDELMRRTSPDATVTDVAVTTGGFLHLGRFSREYSTVFGQYPSETLRRPPPGLPIAQATTALDPS
ncbi:AraC family transcriptional regulator [Rhodococcus sp. LB1]|uniref:AraC family transcriptional regulator n=1 Tax=Rhodococcus sp. LB1 TaxID=1807499 RepID=UPI001E5CC45D|nr:AraC family transcriptional regulator [Rhodococcus sp. LB1]